MISIFNLIIMLIISGSHDQALRRLRDKKGNEEEIPRKIEENAALCCRQILLLYIAWPGHRRNGRRSNIQSEFALYCYNCLYLYLLTTAVYMYRFTSKSTLIWFLDGILTYPTKRNLYTFQSKFREVLCRLPRFLLSRTI